MHPPKIVTFDVPVTDPARATGATGGTPPSAATAPKTAGQAGARAASTSGASQ